TTRRSCHPGRSRPIFFLRAALWRVGPTQRCHPDRSNGAFCLSQYCHPDRSNGAFCRCGVEGSRHHHCVLTCFPLFEFRFSNFAFRSPALRPFLLINLLHPIPSLQHLSRPRPVRRPHNSILLHQINQMCRSAIPDPQSPLQRRSRSSPHFAANPHRVLVQSVIVAFRRSFHSAAFRLLNTNAALLRLFSRRLQQLFVVLRRSLLLPEVAHRADLILRHQRPVYPVQPR